MSMKILGGGALMMLGWLWNYLFIRQVMFNVRVAYPTIKKMNAAQEELIAIGAKRFTTVSLVSCLVVCAIIVAIVLAFCPWYFVLCVFGGALVGFFMYLPLLKSSNREMFDAFCASYYRFVPDDELRTTMYNKKTSQMRIRLRTMGVDDSFIPQFKDKK